MTYFVTSMPDPHSSDMRQLR